jgi:hypothetical protein
MVRNVPPRQMETRRLRWAEKWSIGIDRLFIASENLGSLASRWAGLKSGEACFGKITRFSRHRLLTKRLFYSLLLGEKIKLRTRKSLKYLYKAKIRKYKLIGLWPMHKEIYYYNNIGFTRSNITNKKIDWLNIYFGKLSDHQEFNHPVSSNSWS